MSGLTIPFSPSPNPRLVRTGMSISSRWAAPGIRSLMSKAAGSRDQVGGETLCRPGLLQQLIFLPRPPPPFYAFHLQLKGAVFSAIAAVESATPLTGVPGTLSTKIWGIDRALNNILPPPPPPPQPLRTQEHSSSVLRTRGRRPRFPISFLPSLFVGFSCDWVWAACQHIIQTPTPHQTNTQSPSPAFSLLCGILLRLAERADVRPHTELQPADLDDERRPLMVNSK